MEKISTFLIYIVVFGLTLGLVGGAIYYSFFDDGFDAQREGIDSEGYLSKTGCGSRSMWITFCVYGEEIERPVPTCIFNAQLGERYRLTYNQKNPKEIKVDFSEMFFWKNERIDTTAGYIERIGNGKFFGTPETVEAYFYYFVKNMNYYRGQIIPYKKAKSLRVGKTRKYKVVYSIDNPDKAKIIY